MKNDRSQGLNLLIVFERNFLIGLPPKEEKFKGVILKAKLSFLRNAPFHQCVIIGCKVIRTGIYV